MAAVFLPGALARAFLAGGAEGGVLAAVFLPGALAGAFAGAFLALVLWAAAFLAGGFVAPAVGAGAARTGDSDGAPAPGDGVR